MSESSAKKLDKKMKIINTAFSLFQQNSVAAIAIDDVVKAAGIARGTFYLYFKDKSDLLEQIIMFKSSECMKTLLQTALRKTENEETDFISFASGFLNDYIDFLIENKSILTVLTKNISSCMKLIPYFYDKEIEKFYKIIIEQMKNYGYNEKSANITLFLLVDMIGSACSDAILHKKPYPIDDIRDYILAAAISILEQGKKD